MCTQGLRISLEIILFHNKESKSHSVATIMTMFANQIKTDQRKNKHKFIPQIQVY